MEDSQGLEKTGVVATPSLIYKIKVSSVREILHSVRNLTLLIVALSVICQHTSTHTHVLHKHTYTHTRTIDKAEGSLVTPVPTPAATEAAGPMSATPAEMPELNIVRRITYGPDIHAGTQCSGAMCGNVATSSAAQLNRAETEFDILTTSSRVDGNRKPRAASPQWIASIIDALIWGVGTLTLMAVKTFLSSGKKPQNH